ncbi:MAG: RNase adapter RapZ [Armatimonadota bacterium]|nr:RNase adapter RapZ [Armatimonadota bacterium]MCX7777511.1 RNase adapter RapZ [Armatimonadota bacterium]MDW8025987.1 RNase adapter RapZ [Armatimonadota bacterium]
MEVHCARSLDSEPKLVIVTGMSGAGKTLASRFLEDMGYFCVDNLPPQLLMTLLQLAGKAAPPIERLALVIDIRGGDFFGDLFKALEELRRTGIRFQILFLDANDETLINRYKQTRRRHPLTDGEKDLRHAISVERQMLEPLKAIADLVIDTSRLSPWELKEELARLMMKKGEMLIKLMSFAYKHGVPTDADIVFDVRFLPNPNYEPTLRDLTGLDESVKQFIFGSSVGESFKRMLFELMEFCLPHYVREGKSYLVIAIGCTGGKHRSVAVVDELANWLKRTGWDCFVQHRELQRAGVVITNTSL